MGGNLQQLPIIYPLLALLPITQLVKFENVIAMGASVYALSNMLKIGLTMNE